MMVKKIYFDMDGVLADFNKGVVDLCHIEPVDQHHKTSAMDDVLFGAIRDVEHFYDRLELMPGAKDLFLMVKDKHGDKVEVLTGVPKPFRGILTAGEDKRSWMKRKLSEDTVVNVVLREEKKNYCFGPEYVLIDDFRENIRAWESFGGTGIFHTDAESTIERLRKLGLL